MKKWFSMLLALVMVGMIACAALADETPQPEGGKKFEGDWTIAGGIALIDYEEEGYKVSVDILNSKDNTGSVWEYSCYYKEDRDSLLSVSSSRTNYTYDLDTNEKKFGTPVYEGLDEENQATEFTIDQDGLLIWKDGHDDAGAGLKFANNGAFEGVWKNEADAIRAEIRWNGATEDEMFYTLFITVGKTDGDRYVDYIMNGFYDAKTGKLNAMGTRTVFTKNEKGEYDSDDDSNNYNTVLSKTEDGKVVLEAEYNAILEYSDNWVD